jgi:hypothetical protein
MTQHSTFPRSHLLILGPNSIQSLLPVTPISQAEALLESHRIEDVIQLADEQRKKVQSRLVVDSNEVRLVSSLFIPVSASTIHFGTLCRWMSSRTSTRKSASGVCSRRDLRTQVSASSRGSSTRASLSRTFPTSAARSSTRNRPSTSFQASPSACRRTTPSTTSVRTLFPHPPRTSSLHQ